MEEASYSHKAYQRNSFIPMKTRVKVFVVLCACFFTIAPALAGAQTSSLQSVSSFQKTLVALTNGDRLSQGDAAVIENSTLSAAAQAKADDMAAKGYFAHYSPLGVSPWYWFTSAGYLYTHAGENLAINFDSPADVESAWMVSPAHRANILRGLYTQVGIGVAHGTYQGKPATFIVELFATPASSFASGKARAATKTNPA